MSEFRNMYTGTLSSKPRFLWGSQVRGWGLQVGTSGRLNLRTGPPSWVQFGICEPPSQVRRKEAVAVPRKVPHGREVAP